MKPFLFILCFSFSLFSINAQNQHNPGASHGNRFEQLDYLLQSPNEYRTASGAPGPKYWQQRADYDITVEIDEPKNFLTGAETVTYYNNSPDVLKYVWVQLDENFHRANTDANLSHTDPLPKNISEEYLAELNNEQLKGLGINIESLTDATGKKLNYTINQTMMRIDLPVPLKPGQKFAFNVKWNYQINEKGGDRGGYEYFEEDGNNLYSITQWYPRLAVYSDFQGWQTLHFTGGSEFALTFGNFKVKITVPSDHIVAATGECKNYPAVLSAKEGQRLQQAQTAKEPVEIVTLSESVDKLSTKSTKKKTWIFEATNVRDFAFNSSRRFAWDAMPVYIDGKKIMCMSYYGKEAYPVYSKFSTKLIAHTLKVYSRITFPYPYPVAQSVEANEGMEYPMLAMNYGRVDKAGKISPASLNGMKSVIIHEVGHNFFPMIVNSDERQWWWMDEGLNSFCQYLAEQEWEPGYPSKRGPVQNVVSYMRLPKDQLEPIMTKGDAISNVGGNGYLKAATGLNLLRETIMGHELFDFSFREYARRWAFKHPTPADLFRTMEDASAVDLDWFWRGWFFSTDPVDISLDSVRWLKMDTTLDGKEINLYELKFSNKGGMIMPVIIEWTYTDGTKELETIPVAVWMKDETGFTKVFQKSKSVAAISLDPNRITGDINELNGSWPVKEMPTKFQLYKSGQQ